MNSSKESKLIRDSQITFAKVANMTALHCAVFSSINPNLNRIQSMRNLWVKEGKKWRELKIPLDEK